MPKPVTYSQAKRMQRVLVAEVERDGVTLTAKAAACNAFANLEYLKRVMRMKPNPKPVDVQPTGAGRALIDYRTLVRRPKAIVDVSEPKPPGPRTVMTSSAYYKPQADSKPIENKPACGLEATTGSVPASPESQTSPQEQKPLNGS